MSPPSPREVDRGDRRAGALAVAGLVAYAVLFFAPATVGGGQFFFRDVSQNHYPMRLFDTSELEAGRLPLWNPHLTFGQPAVANPNYMVFHPTTLLFLVLSFDAAFRWSIVLQYVLAAGGTYLLLRDLGCGRPGAWLAGLAFAYSGPMVSLGNLYNVLGTAAWFPAGVLLARRAVRRGGPGWVLAAAAVFAVQIVAGEPLIVLASVTLGCLFAWRLRGDVPLIRPARRLAGVVLLGACLSAVQVFPTLELLPLSERGAGFDFGIVAKWSTHPLRLVETVVPGLFGDATAMTPDAWWGEGFFESSLPLLLGVYLGAPVLLLAAAGAGTLRRNPVALDLTAVGGVAGLFALGRHGGVFWLLHRFVPGFESVRYPSKFLLVVAFCAACLAAIGLDRLSASGAGRLPRGLTVAAGALALMPAAGAVLFGLVPSAASRILHGPMAAGGIEGGARDAGVLPQVTAACLYGLLLTAAAYALCALLVRRPDRPRLPAMLIVALVSVDLFAANRSLNPTVDPQWYRVEPRIVKTIREVDPRGRIYRFPRPAGFALRMRDGTSAASTGFLWDRLSLRNVTGLQYGLRFAWDRNNERLNPGTSAYVSRRMEAEYSLEERVRTWKLGSTRFVISYEPLDHPQLRALDAVRGESTHPLLLHEVRDTLPRARVVGRAERVADRDDALERLRRPGFDPASAVLLPGAPGTGSGVPGGVPAEIVRDEPNRVEVITRAPFDGHLVLSDTFFPGWRAYVDGRPATIEPAYLLFRAVEVPAGEHRVTFRYAPSPLRAGGALALAGLLAVATAAGIRWRRRGRRADAG